MCVTIYQGPFVAGDLKIHRSLALGNGAGVHNEFIYDSVVCELPFTRALVASKEMKTLKSTEGQKPCTWKWGRCPQ